MSKKERKPEPFEDKGLYEKWPKPTPEESARMSYLEFARMSLKRALALEGDAGAMKSMGSETRISKIKNRHPLLADLEKAKTPAKRKAAQDAIDRDPIASEIQYHLARYEESDPAEALKVLGELSEEQWLRAHEGLGGGTIWHRAFAVNGLAAGWHLVMAYLLATAGETARHGKKMDYRKATEEAKRARAERGGRAKKPTPLKTAVLDAWEDYREDNGADASRSAFVKWLYHEADAYDIEAICTDEEFRMPGEAVKGETIRKNWLK